MNLFVKLLILGCVLAGSWSVAQADPLFSEDWSSGNFNPSIWAVYRDIGHASTHTTGTGVVAIDSTGTAQGDPAAYTKGPQLYGGDDWNYNYYTTATFTRANHLRCTFFTWRDHTKPTWAGYVNWCIEGPFHNNVYPNDVYNGVEAAVSGWDTLPQKFSVKGWNTGNACTSVTTALAASTNRATGIWIRVTLGNTRGGKLEYSTDGSHYTLVDDQTDVTGTLGAANVRIGFGTHAAAVFIDNIVLEDDTHVGLPVEISEFSTD